MSFSFALAIIFKIIFRSIESNQFSGIVPPELGNLVNLEYLLVFLSFLLFNFSNHI